METLPRHLPAFNTRGHLPNANGQVRTSSICATVSVDGMRRYAHQKEDIVRLSPEALKAKMAAKGSAAQAVSR